MKKVMCNRRESNSDLADVGCLTRFRGRGLATANSTTKLRLLGMKSEDVSKVKFIFFCRCETHLVKTSRTPSSARASLLR